MIPSQIYFGIAKEEIPMIHVIMGLKGSGKTKKLYKTIGQDQAANEAFVDWVADFAKENNMEITMTISADPAAASEGMKKYL